MDVDRLRKQNLVFKYANNQIWKYSIPIDTLIGGIIGTYVDSVLVDGRGVIKFNFYFNENIKMSFYDAKAIINSVALQNEEIGRVDFYLTNIRE